MLNSKLLQRQPYIEEQQNLQEMEQENVSKKTGSSNNTVASSASKQKTYNFQKKTNNKDFIINQENFQSNTPGIRFTPQPKVQKISNKIKKSKKNQWGRNYQLLKILAIEELPMMFSKTKRFKVQIRYRDEKQQIRTVCIRFGDRKRQEYIDTGEIHTKNVRLGYIGDVNKFTPFDKQFWNYHLLNTCPTIQEAESYFKKMNNMI